MPVRRLRVFYSLSRSGVPVLVMASLVPAFDACSNDNLPDPGPAQRADASATGGTGGRADTDSSSGTGGTIPPIMPPPRPTPPDVTSDRICDGAVPDAGYPFPPQTRP